MIKKLLPFLFICCISTSYAGSFTAGNIVVVRVGDGTAALSSAATAIYLDEYNSTGTLVQSIAIPTVASGTNHALTFSGTSTSQGALTLSPAGKFLVLGGMDAAVGTTGVSTAVVRRTIARIDTAGVVNTSLKWIPARRISKIISERL
jgi:hypothetical protein